MSTEAMKQALEALELMYACYAHSDWISHKQQEEKILAQCVATTMTLRKAIQEEALRNVQRIGQEIEQEPVAWMNATRTNAVFREVETSIPNWSDYYYIPLYTHSQPKRGWIGLTDKERRYILKYTPTRTYMSQYDWNKSVMEYIEQTLKDKNT
jgi:hypothetical protein